MGVEREDGEAENKVSIIDNCIIERGCQPILQCKT